MQLILQKNTPTAPGELYLDAPVTDIRSWPGRFSESAEWKQCLECYELTNETAESFAQNPNDYAEKNAKDGIPVIIVAGDSDSVVPFSQNGAVYLENYKKYSDTIESIVKPGCDHHPAQSLRPYSGCRIHRKVCSFKRRKTVTAG